MSTPDEPLSAGSVAVVLGTRPELVKLAEPVRLLGPAARVLHTGQHYDGAMSQDVLAGLGMPEPEYLAGVGGRPRAVQIATALEGLDARFADRLPRAVVVQGDTNAALSGALAANARDIPLVHVEAGLRSHDRAMPEEHNRVVIDRLADVLCAATPDNRSLLLAEGTPDQRISVTGNTVVEAVHHHRPRAGTCAEVLARHALERDGYVLATIHRPENTDDPAVLAAVLEELAGLARELPVVLPLHPRTRVRAEQAGLRPLLADIRCIAPVDYASFLALAGDAAVLISDSGGVQEESTVLGRPLVCVRRSTERPEALAEFAELVPPGPRIGAAVRRRLAEGAAGLRRLASLPSPFGDGRASRRIVDLIARAARREDAVPGPPVERGARRTGPVRRPAAA
ncbi:non-hydrolyzing UDP-N-acetylglucosamine 2-epimerase [Streptomyces sp. NPDC060194]|uniref:non-hydrolyzing UDP-N-acetylglucosamine 2-epimerase n=1 Tax=Streptomyces sp. NPDC060194 TaxID=3347069 RepID=UPI00365E5E79